MNNTQIIATFLNTNLYIFLLVEASKHNLLMATLKNFEIFRCQFSF